MNGHYVMDGLRLIMQDGCDAIDCNECPFYVDQNDTECANFIAKSVLEADWSGFVMTDSGLMEKEYANGQEG